MSWELRVANQARKSLIRLSKNIANKILVVLDEFSLGPYLGDIKKIKGYEDTWRRRVGRYRITFEVPVSSKVISVTSIEIKTDNTYK